MTRAEIVALIDHRICWAGPREHPYIRGLTVRQPFASMIAEGEKTIELRTMRTHYRGALIIHAGLDDSLLESLDDCRDGRYPRGCTVGIARIADCRHLEPDDAVAAGMDPRLWPRHWDGGPPSWIDDVWGWVLDDVTPLPEVGLRGRQGLWKPTRQELWTIRSAVTDGQA
ncbi:MAG: ASCH domain-containing protein [Spirochaetaceae bacterium]|nr:ASCH domain-containing protein [Spirochaetaceae bacterium]